MATQEDYFELFRWRDELTDAYGDNLVSVLRGFIQTRRDTRLTDPNLVQFWHELRAESEAEQERLMYEYVHGICPRCNNTGVIDTGNNDLPCDCSAGNRALFNVTGIPEPVSGADVRRHYLNTSPEPRPTVYKAPSMWDLARTKMREANRPLTVTDLSKLTGHSCEALSSLLLKKVKEGTVTRVSGVGPRSGYGYSLPPDPNAPTPTAYDRLLDDPV